MVGNIAAFLGGRGPWPSSLLKMDRRAVLLTDHSGFDAADAGPAAEPWRKAPMMSGGSRPGAERYPSVVSMVKSTWRRWARAWGVTR
jgi:hypothetical protein